jgi:hypothetical protein
MFLEFFLLSMWKREFVCSLASVLLTGIVLECIGSRERCGRMRNLLPGGKYSYNRVLKPRVCLISLVL